MKEKIYTIPVNEAFSTDCECPLCFLEQKVEKQSIEYVLGSSLMKPESRIESNKKGFCHCHFELLYDSKINTQGLGLIMETHQAKQIGRLKRFAKDILNQPSSRFSNKKETKKLSAQFTDKLSKNEIACVVCDKINFTMDRYIDVLFYLWLTEAEFRVNFKNSKGFCLKHFRILIEDVGKYLKANDLNEFLSALIPLEIQNMERIEKELNWFNKKSDYRNAEAPWGNSEDSVIRSIQKITGYFDS